MRQRVAEITTLGPESKYTVESDRVQMQDGSNVWLQVEIREWHSIKLHCSYLNQFQQFVAPPQDVPVVIKFWLESGNARKFESTQTYVFGQTNASVEHFMDASDLEELLDFIVDDSVTIRFIVIRGSSVSDLGSYGS